MFITRKEKQNIKKIAQGMDEEKRKKIIKSGSAWKGLRAYRKFCIGCKIKAGRNPTLTLDKYCEPCQKIWIEEMSK